jgi:N-acetylated-alpha-linked acidic dipeptidase
MIRRIAVFAAALGLIASSAVPLNAQSTQLLGFTAESTATQRALEATFDASLRGSEMQGWLKHLSARPHHLGSPYDKSNAEYLLGLFKSFGYDAKIERFEVLFPTPKVRVLEMTAPTVFHASLTEQPVKEDHTSAQTSEQLPLYNAYSIDGDVHGQLVYANYGVPADYEVLASHGIDVRGKIVITRYGGSWRGIKPKVAAEHGAVGCIIYSDPRDDGYFGGNTYPNGSYRNPTGGQRGSVADIPTYPGDPSMGGNTSLPGSKHLALKDIPTLTKIPVLPISYTDATPLLKALGGPVAPVEWRGALPFTYHLGGGPATVHLKVASNWKIVNAYDVIATMRGSERPDEWVIRGNHHDAWVNGAGDPLSGAVSVLEEARAIGDLARNGYKPKRSITFTLWDGEEPGLLGSSAWSEAHEAELGQHAVVYINTDGNGRGYLGVSGSHSLEGVVSGIADDVMDPERNVTVKARALARQRASRGVDNPVYHIEALGSGSDYSSFVDHAGVASLNFGYGGEEGGGSYHSIFDSFDEFTRFIDPGMKYEVTLAKTTGRAVMRFADADLLPYAFEPSAQTIKRYVDELVKLNADEKKTVDSRNAMIKDGTLVAASDPHFTFVAPKAQDPVPILDFAPLVSATERLTAAAKVYDAARAQALTGATPATAAVLSATDAVLLSSEHALLSPAGLPRRPWYRHEIYAPGFYTGYGVKTIPMVREALEQHQYDEARAGVTLVASTLDAYTAKITAATAALGAK